MLIDTHAHLDEDAFSGDMHHCLDRARDAGVGRIITIGTTLESSRRAVELAERRPEIFAAIGIHPNYASAAGEDDWPELVKLAAHPRVVGIGETGLDRYWDHTPIDEQRDYFHRHLELSRETGKPFIIHCRDADADVLEILKNAAGQGTLNGVMHCFSGSQEMADECLRLGMHLSFAGVITFKKNAQLRAVAAAAPLDRIMVETDAPYLAPTPHRGKRNEPSWVKFTAQQLAEARGATLEDIAAATTANATRLFRLPD
ncbi:putative deoxyribonuclease YcfH [Caulifigura coniformis]|uniref:Putative deoxyribonuclease YcfH n=1 Tax=Caulifigura coniformis TaxID=2527983 RepID=A0A517SH47_9PLAN|nr:TatD family hydrolase [Caulifigura coniformis]QDT55432.1 putative deoxyribonuclease YcfH [Caulifigura coniformis]